MISSISYTILAYKAFSQLDIRKRKSVLDKASGHSKFARGFGSTFSCALVNDISCSFKQS